MLTTVDGVHDEIPAMRKLWEDLDLEYLGGGFGLEDYLLMTTFPVESLADLDGRKINATGPAANWLKNTGAVGGAAQILSFFPGVTREELPSGCGMGRAASNWLTARGMRVCGTDAWSWDAPFAQTARRAGVERASCHIEKLGKLEALPATGFEVQCFPVKIKGAAGDAHPNPPRRFSRGCAAVRATGRRWRADRGWPGRR